MNLDAMKRAAKMLDDASVPMDHRQAYISDDTGEYLQCTCGLRQYLDDEAMNG